MMQPMRVYSWNVLFLNKELDDAFEFISRLDFNVLCLQEVPEQFLARLKTLPVYVAAGPDVDRLFARGVEHDNLVILSKYPIRSSATFSIPVPRIRLRTKMFVQLMRPFGWSKIANRGGLWADIETPEKLVRVFCLHLTLAHPSARAQEYELAMRHLDPRIPAIVCGDFNVLEKWHIVILNWILGGTWGDVFHFRRERIRKEARFASHGLQNPLRGTVTQTISRSQLDHILVPQSAHVEKAEVVAERHGSDHHPVCVELSL